MRKVIIILLLTCTGCASNSLDDSELELTIFRSAVDQYLESIPEMIGEKRFGIYWTGKILNGHYRNTFVRFKPDSFRVVKDLDSVCFSGFLKVLHDTLPIRSLYDDRIGNRPLSKRLPGKDSINRYFILEAGSSRPVISGDKALIYFEMMDIFYHNGDGEICELKKVNGRWILQRTLTAWQMRNDTVRMGVFY